MENEEVLHQNFYQQYLQMKQCIFLYTCLASHDCVEIVLQIPLCTCHKVGRKGEMRTEELCSTAAPAPHVTKQMQMKPISNH